MWKLLKTAFLADFFAFDIAPFVDLTAFLLITFWAIVLAFGWVCCLFVISLAFSARGVFVAPFLGGILLSFAGRAHLQRSERTSD
ncbi:hypothetical protein KC320_g74 [Hortaea werneckii]|nr:hypothetical protein KC320_g74 [Hortaea werneckii]